MLEAQLVVQAANVQGTPRRQDTVMKTTSDEAPRVQSMNVVQIRRIMK